MLHIRTVWAQLGKTNDAILHILLFTVMMLLLSVAGFISGSWGWYIAMLLGWGSVLFVQSLYTFVYRRIFMTGEEEQETFKKAAEDTANVMAIRVSSPYGEKTAG